MTELKKSVIVIGSESDGKYMIGAKKVFEYLKIPYDAILASADRTPDLVRKIGEKLNRGEYLTCIAAAGASAVLSAVIKSYAPTKPVIGVPIAHDNAPLAGADALYSVVQRPPGSPVVSVGINMAENAALFVAELYILLYPELEEKLLEYRRMRTSEKGYDTEEFQWPSQS